MTNNGAVRSRLVGRNRWAGVVAVVALAAMAALGGIARAAPGAPTASPVPPVDCVPRSVIDALGPDGLPPLGSVVTSRRENRKLIRKYSKRIRHTYAGVVALTSGPGWGRAWTNKDGTIEVVSVHDYAIIATVKSASQCPPIPGYAAGLDRATIFFRHL